MTPAHPGLADPRAYVRLAAIVRQQITNGTLNPGQPAPSITRLSQEHAHARLTCGKALRMLEGEGLLTRIPGPRLLREPTLTLTRAVSIERRALCPDPLTQVADQLLSRAVIPRIGHPPVRYPRPETR